MSDAVRGYEDFIRVRGIEREGGGGGSVGDGVKASDVKGPVSEISR